eukprot:jgi/Mesvir1/12924/Mv05942-RA.1
MADGIPASEVSLDWSEGEDVDMDQAVKGGFAKFLPAVPFPSVAQPMERLDPAAVPAVVGAGTSDADRAERASNRTEIPHPGAPGWLVEGMQQTNFFNPDLPDIPSGPGEDGDRLRHDLLQSQMSAHEQREEIKRLQAALSVAQSLARQHEDVARRHEEKAMQHEEEARRLRDELSKAQVAPQEDEEAARLRSDLSSAHELSKSQQSSLEQLREELARAQVGAREREEEARLLRVGLLGAQEVIQQREGALEALTQDLNEAKRKAEEAERECAEGKREAEEAKRELLEVKGALAEAMAASDEAVKELAVAKRELMEVKAALEVVKGALAEATRKAEEAERELIGVQRDSGEVRRERAEAMGASEEVKAALAEAQRECVGAKRLVEEQEQELARLTADLASTQRAMVDREGELSRLRSDMLDTQRAAKEHQQQLLASVDALAASTQRVESLRVEVNALRMEAEDLRLQLGEKVEEAAALQVQVDRLREVHPEDHPGAAATTAGTSVDTHQGGREGRTAGPGHELAARERPSSAGIGQEIEGVGLSSHGDGADPLRGDRPGWNGDDAAAASAAGGRSAELGKHRSDALVPETDPLGADGHAASGVVGERGAGRGQPQAEEIRRLRALLTDAETRAASKDAMSASANAARAAAQKLLLAADARAEGLRLRAEELEVRLEEAEQQLARLHGRARGCFPPGGLCRWLMRWHRAEDDLMEPLT